MATNHVLGYSGAMRPQHAIPFPRVTLAQALRWHRLRRIERKIGLPPGSLVLR